MSTERRGRPEILFPLFADLTSLKGVGSAVARTLSRLNITHPRDLLFHLPYRLVERRCVASVREADAGETLSLEVEVLRHAPPPRAALPYRVEVQDAQTSFELVFFRAKAEWLKTLLPLGARRVLGGKVELYDGRYQMVHPEPILPPERAGEMVQKEALYPLTQGLTQKKIAGLCADVLGTAPDLAEWIDPHVLAQKSWPSWRKAIGEAHAPQSLSAFAPEAPARARLAYDEFFAHQLTLALARQARRKKPGQVSRGTGRLSDALLQALPFALTSAQLRVIEEIRADMAGAHRMNRLLQGDVGSGKTLVALFATLAAVEAGGQSVIMAPTEILAAQHYDGLSRLADKIGLRLALLTGRDKGRGRAQKLAALAQGQIDLLIGTHAVFQPDVQFSDLRLVVIDEQHRFGVHQRLQLSQKAPKSDVLVMTATPIPRSLALSHYGDLDISLLDEKPPGRQEIETAILSSARISELISRLGCMLDAGQQAYWVCPLVEESEHLPHMAAEERYKILAAHFGAERVGLVHGQMPVAQKDAAMADFAAARSQLLVATTVIEVGVDVPNATIMVIEQAENFGLAQLHQLRGRVGRGAQKSTCLLLYTPPLGEVAQKRLSIMRETNDGFKISEADLSIRGAGDVLGVQQSGLPQFRIADLERQAGLMEMAARDARLLLAQDPRLEGPRGQAARLLLYLLRQDEAIRLMGH